MKGRLPARSAERYAAMCANTLRRFLPRSRTDVRIGGPSNREETVAALGRALGRRESRVAIRKQLGRGGALAAAAAVVLAVGWMRSWRQPANVDRVAVSPRADHALTMLGPLDGGPLSNGAVVVGGGGGSAPRLLTHGMTLEPGTRLMAPTAAEVRIGTADGTVLTLERAGELTVVEQSAVQSFSLKQGAVRAQVAKLQPRERFVITTEDAAVEVHGTVFRVAVVPSDPGCGASVRTRISVFEGVVSVRSSGVETFIPPGGRWPAGCPEAESEAAGPKVVAAPPSAGPLQSNYGSRRMTPAAGRRREPSVVPAAPATGGSASAISGSVLEAENDLFLAAVRAKWQERPGDAVRLFSMLVDAYPDGPLTEGAMAERVRLLRSIDRAAARRAADQYLLRFPGGFARAEAVRVVGSGP